MLAAALQHGATAFSTGLQAICRCCHSPHHQRTIHPDSLLICLQKSPTSHPHEHSKGIKTTGCVPLPPIPGSDEQYANVPSCSPEIPMKLPVTYTCYWQNLPWPLILVCVLLLWQPIAHADTCPRKGRVVVSEPAAIFVAPSSSELSRLPEDERQDISELVSDFYRYVDGATPYLRSIGIRKFITGSKYIQINRKSANVVCINRSKLGDYVAFILSDGSADPVVITSISGSADVIELAKSYFEKFSQTGGR